MSADTWVLPGEQRLMTDELLNLLLSTPSMHPSLVTVIAVLLAGISVVPPEVEADPMTPFGPPEHNKRFRSCCQEIQNATDCDSTVKLEWACYYPDPFSRGKKGYPKHQEFIWPALEKCIGDNYEEYHNCWTNNRDNTNCCNDWGMTEKGCWWMCDASAKPDKQHADCSAEDSVIANACNMVGEHWDKDPQMARSQLSALCPELSEQLADVHARRRRR